MSNLQNRGCNCCGCGCCTGAFPLPLTLHINNGYCCGLPAKISLPIEVGSRCTFAIFGGTKTCSINYVSGGNTYVGTTTYNYSLIDAGVYKHPTSGSCWPDPNQCYFTVRLSIDYTYPYSFGFDLFGNPRFNYTTVNYTIRYQVPVNACSDICDSTLTLCETTHGTITNPPLAGFEICLPSSVTVSCDCEWACTGGAVPLIDGLLLDWPGTFCGHDTTFAFSLTDTYNCSITFGDEYTTNWVDGSIAELTGCDTGPCRSFQGSARYRISITLVLTFNSDGSVSGTIVLNLVLEARYRTYVGTCPTGSWSPWNEIPFNCDPPIAAIRDNLGVDHTDFCPGSGWDGHSWLFGWTFHSASGSCSDVLAPFTVVRGSDPFVSTYKPDKLIFRWTTGNEGCDEGTTAQSIVNIPCDPRDPAVRISVPLP